MSDKPISDLPHRMIADMTVRSFSERRSTVSGMLGIARFLCRSAATAISDDIRRFQLA